MTDLKTAWKKKLVLRAKARRFWAKADVHMVRKEKMTSGAKSLARKKAEAMQALYRARGDVFWAKAELAWTKALIAAHGPAFSDVQTVFRERDYDCVVAGVVFRHTTT